MNSCANCACACCQKSDLTASRRLCDKRAGVLPPQPGVDADMVSYAELAAIRLGYGLSPRIASPDSAAAVLTSVPDAAPAADALRMTELRELHFRSSQLYRRGRDGDEQALDEARKLRRRISEMSLQATLQGIVRAVEAPSGFGERLVQFWSDHFTVSGGNPIYRAMTMAFVNEAIRPHLGSRFEDMLFAAETHPSMLVYLDQDRSVGPNSRLARRQKRQRGINENLAREMIELHSLGAGADYSQKDVRQLAKLLTGLTYKPGDDGVFTPNRAEPGAETVLGRSYGDDGPAKLRDIRQVTRDLARHPATAGHLARKLAVHFVADDPPQSLVDRLAATYRDSNGDLSALNGELVAAPELAENFRSKIRQPFDFIVASLRALGVPGQRVRDLKLAQGRSWLLSPMTAMGQKWGFARGPDGWPEEAANWATPHGLAARIDWTMRVPGKLQPNLPDPRAMLDAALGDTASEALRWAVPKAESTRDGMLLVLASADFNRR